jgi:hypothetical protein
VVEFLYFQTIVQVRVAVMPDGTLGQPEIVKKFTSEMKHSATTQKPKKQTKRVTTTLGDVVEL